MNEQAPYKVLFIKRGLTEIRKLFLLVEAHGGFIAGGYARYCLSPVPKPVPPSDVDVFCKEEGAHDKLIKALEGFGAKIKIQTVNATTIIPPPDWVACPTIQIINPAVMCGDPWSIISRFDFTIAIAALIGKDQGIVHNNFEEDEYKGALVVNYIQCPVGNLRRAMKYIKRGYKLSVREMIRFYEDWDNKSLERKKEIMDLVGMKPEEWTEQTREKFRDLIYID